MGIGKALFDNTTIGSYAGAYRGQYRPDMAGMLIGAGLGATAGSVIPNESPGVGAAIGAGVGMVAAPMLGLAGLGMAKAGAAAFNNAGAIAKGVGIAGATVAGLATAPLTIPGALIASSHMRESKTNIGKPLKRHAITAEKAMRTLGRGLLKYEPESYTKDKKGDLVKKSGRYKVGKRGLALAGIGAALVGSKNVAQDYYNDKAGMAGGTQRATPAYMNNAGASGDLVFALNANRRG